MNVARVGLEATSEDERLSCEPAYGDALAADLVEVEQTREPKFLLGVFAGLAAAVASAVVWCAIAIVTQYQVGWMALGVGLLVGWSVRRAGRGIDARFRIVGGVCALCGCLLGNLLIGVYALAMAEQVPIVGVFNALDMSLTIAILEAMYSPVDLLFYGLAMYEGHQLSGCDDELEESIE